MKNKFGSDDYIFQADSAPCHKSLETMNFNCNGLKYDPEFWLPESPDLNAIENVWHEMKEFLRSIVKPNNLAELINGIRTFWKTRMTKNKCRRYIKHVIKVIPQVERNKGGLTLS